MLTFTRGALDMRIRSLVTLVTALSIAAVASSPAAAKVTNVTMFGSACSIAITIDDGEVSLGGPIMLNSTFGIVATSDVLISGSAFYSQVFVCHGSTPSGLIAKAVHLTSCSPTPSAVAPSSGDLVAHVTITPKTWTVTVALTGQHKCVV